jgi:SPOR domain
VKESLENAKKILQRSNPSTDEALAQISKAMDQLHFTQKDIKSAITQSSSPRQNAEQWVVVIGADRKIGDAKDEVNTAQSKGFENVTILLRDGWYRTIIPFSSENDANAALSDISKRIRQGSYTRNLTTWCKQIIETSEESVKFKKCV